MRRELIACVLVVAVAGCDAVEDALGDGGVAGAVGLAQQCNDVCGKINQCGATPPRASAGGLGENLPDDNPVVDCAANCVQTEKRARLGYSTCQIACIQGAACGEVENCWRASSATYAQYCEVPEPAPIEPAPTPDGGTEPMIDNGSETGNEAADELLDDPAINDAVNESDTPIHFGDDPPSLMGLYAAVGAIDDARNARPVGSPINTRICFRGVQHIAGSPTISYCERGIPNVAQAPITGAGNAFTIYFDFRPEAQVTLLFSGALREDQSASGVEALVTYTHAVGVWEHSLTDWTREAETCECPF